MVEAQKDERKENRGDRSFIQRDVYAQYCGYNTKMDGYTHCRYIIPNGSDIMQADILEFNPLPKAPTIPLLETTQFGI